MLDRQESSFGMEADRASNGCAWRWGLVLLLAAAVLLAAFYAYRDRVRIERHAQEHVCLDAYLPAVDRMESADEGLWVDFDGTFPSSEATPMAVTALERLRASVQAFHEKLDPRGAPISMQSFLAFQRVRCEVLIRMLDDLRAAADPATGEVAVSDPAFVEWQARYRLLGRMNTREYKGIETLLRRHQGARGTGVSAALDRLVADLEAFQPSLMPLQEQPETLLRAVDEPMEQ